MAALLLIFTCGEALSDDLTVETDDDISEITLQATRAANNSPASSYPTALQEALVVDNATDSEYQPFPGTPASGRQISLSASYAW